MKRMMAFICVLVILTIAACSKVNSEEVKEIGVREWVGKEVESETTFLQEEETIRAFVDATKHAKQLDESSVIQTPPILTYTLVMQNDDTREYHLWLTEDGQGYIQSLIPEKSSTYRIDDESVAALSNVVNHTNRRGLLKEVEFE